MFYEAVAADGARSIGASVSRDGLRGWRRLPAPVLAPGEAGAWDAGGVGAPCAVPMAGTVSEGKTQPTGFSETGGGGASAVGANPVAVAALTLGPCTRALRRRALEPL